jgi:hypothetical protein
MQDDPGSRFGKLMSCLFSNSIRRSGYQYGFIFHQISTEGYRGRSSDLRFKESDI